MTMTAWDLTLEADHGAMLCALDVLTVAGVNIEAVSGSAGAGSLHLVVADRTRAVEALDTAGFLVWDERPVLLVDAEKRPGILAEYARLFMERGVVLERIYIAGGDRLVIGASDLDRARAVLGDVVDLQGQVSRDRTGYDAGDSSTPS